MWRWILNSLCVLLFLGLPVLGIWLPDGSREELIPSDRAALEGLRVWDSHRKTVCGLGSVADVRVAIECIDLMTRRFAITDLWLAEEHVMRRFRHCRHLVRIHVSDATGPEVLAELRREFPRCQIVMHSGRDLFAG